MSHTGEGNGSVKKQSSSQVVQVMLQEQLVAREISLENPSSLDKGYSMKQGMGAENVHGSNIKHKFHANVQELNA